MCNLTPGGAIKVPGSFCAAGRGRAGEVIGNVHFAHASAAKRFTDSIVAKRFPDHFPAPLAYLGSGQVVSTAGF